MRPRSIIARPSVWVALVAVVLVTVVLVLRARGPLVHTTRATHQDLEQHIVASGRVWAPARVQVAAQTTGLVAVGAALGQRVKAGDLLVQIDDAEARAQIAQAKAAVEQANAKVEQLRKVGAIVTGEGLRQAQTNLERAESDLARTETLFASGAVARAQLDEAHRTVDIARAQKAVADAQQVSSAPLGADSRVALTALLQAQAQLTGANVHYAQTRIMAVSDGVVLSRAIEPGDVVQPGKTLLVMAVDGAPELVFQPDERNLAAIALGQKARASADAYPQDIMDAEVSYIAPSVDAQRGSVEVRLRVANPPKFLKPDMTVSVDLTAASKKQALVLPSDALHAIASSAPWVLTVEDDKVVRRELTLGLRGELSVEVTAGLAPDAEVIVPDGQVLRTGQRVRAEPR
jgi:HlyD family secretion protein